MPRYTPDITLAELRAARDHDPEAQKLAAIMRRAADNAAADLWPDPRERRTAGIGALVASATLGDYSEGYGAGSTVLAAIGLFGLGLVESADEEIGAKRA